MTIYRAKLETTHFSFEAYGDTEKAARDGMRAAWRRHCRQCKMPDNWREFADEVSVYPVEVGKAYRDQEKI